MTNHAVSEDAGAILRGEWQRLWQEQTVLRSATENLKDSRDVEALRSHVASLRAHQIGMKAFVAELEAYHHAHGPLGLPAASDDVLNSDLAGKAGLAEARW